MAHDLEIIDDYTIRVNGCEHNLTALESELFTLMYSFANNACRYYQLQRVKNVNSQARHPRLGYDTLKKTISKMRKKGLDIANVKNVGYKLNV